MQSDPMAIPIPTKACSKCKRVLPLTTFASNSWRNGRQRIHSWCRKCQAAAARTYSRTPAGKRVWRDHFLRKRYGISLVEYEAMLAAQGGVCAICGDPPSGTDRRNMQLHVDHCHTTGKVRSLLCELCNKGLGSFKDDPVRLHAALEYLRTHSTKLFL